MIAKRAQDVHMIIARYALDACKMRVRYLYDVHKIITRRALDVCKLSIRCP